MSPATTPAHAATCDALYDEYETLHRYFGEGSNPIMKHLRTQRGTPRDSAHA